MATGIYRMQGDAAAHDTESGRGESPVPETNPAAAIGAERAEILRKAQAEADTIRGELPLIKVSMEYELTRARENAAAAQARLAEAHEEAQSLVQDAAEQASLIRKSAEASAEQVIERGHTDAAEIIAAARVEAEAIKTGAGTLMEAEQTRVDELRNETRVELENVRAEHERNHQERMAAAEQEFAALRAEADDHVERMRVVADRVSLEGQQAAQRELDQAMSDAEKLYAEAQEVANRLLEQSRAKAAKETAEVAEQVAWTQQMVAGLREAAELDAQRVRHDAHAAAAALTARVRQRLIERLMASRRVLQERQVEAMGLRMDAYQQLEDARRDAERTREQATSDAARIVAEAEAEAKRRFERAERREAEAEAGARAVRAHVAEEVGRTQQEMFELRRVTKAEVAELMQRARADADEARSQARQSVADARAEMEELQVRRQAITLELGGLSGVIEALSMPDLNARAGASRGRRADAEPLGTDDEGDAVQGTESGDDKLSDLAGDAMGESDAQNGSAADVDSDTEAPPREPEAEATGPEQQAQPSDETSANDQSEPEETMGST
jgi:F0F1-type ATP synthase membrane subunit b/b'